MYYYLKALHIIFVVTWFAGMFYMPRLFIYATEAGEQQPEARDILRSQFAVMMKRLWYGITWPSAVLTLIFGTTVLLKGDWDMIVFQPGGRWLLIKLLLVAGLYFYHFTLHHIFQQQMKGVFRYSSQQLRVWNEVATIFLIAIVMLVTVKESMSMVWGLAGLILFIIVLMSAIKIYKGIREKKNS
ncbi:CopD family protein [Flavihumibacter rivuli]|uniref:CopD family protein n=1 Tax=Flavihumibacter rivuli TaxID=2838156 RepID=UPI001BDF0306|nr:CopD family protein [Flavihumibacter rivuli]ULQ55049.1 CopD family protein [Flavihumibacter rivuli]